MRTISMMTLTEIANKLDEHLRRWERDPKINTCQPNSTLRRFYLARAHRAGRYVQVKYVAYQGGSNLTREDALMYLEWADEGHVGKHYDALGRN